MQPSVPKSVTAHGVGTLAFDGTNYTCTMSVGGGSPPPPSPPGGLPPWYLPAVIVSYNPPIVRGPTLVVVETACLMAFGGLPYRPGPATEAAGALINAFFGRGAVGPSS